MGTESHDVTIVWVSALESMPIHSQDSLQDLRVEERKDFLFPLPSRAPSC